MKRARRQTPDDIGADERALTPVVSKTLVIGIALLYVSGLTTLLLGGVVPEYRASAGEELGERVLAQAAGSIEGAVPEGNGTVSHTATVDLPPTIEDRTYELVLRGEQLILEHETAGAETRLSLPPGASTENNTWASGGKLEINVEGESGDWTVRIDS